MGYFLMAVILVVSILLGAVILVQNPKGGGLATGFQGASQMGGVQRTTDFLEKATWYLTGGLFVLCIVAGIFFGEVNEDVGVEAPANTAMPMTGANGAVGGEAAAGE